MIQYRVSRAGAVWLAWPDVADTANEWLGRHLADRPCLHTPYIRLGRPLEVPRPALSGYGRNPYTTAQHDAARRPPGRDCNLLNLTDPTPGCPVVVSRLWLR